MNSELLLDVLIIGAGQAGLAIGQQLAGTGARFLLVDGHERIGDSWRKRFDSLTLFTPRAYSALPGLSLNGDPDGYPAKDELADYLERYAAHFQLPVEMNTGIYRLEQQGKLFHATTTGDKVIAARSVVIATGAFQQPVIPAMAQNFEPQVTQLTPDDYRNPGNIPSGTVLVVGDGATGRQIALELSNTHKVLLANGRPRRVSKDRLLGKSIFWWLDKLGLMRKSPQSRIGQKLRETDPFPGKHLELDRLRKHGITITGRLQEANGHWAIFASGDARKIDSVIWATGYQDRTDWIHIPGAVDDQQRFLQKRGVSPVPGLYFIGRNWQASRGSALVTGVGTDAAFIAGEVMRSMSGSPVSSSPAAPLASMQPATP